MLERPIGPSFKVPSGAVQFIGVSIDFDTEMTSGPDNNLPLPRLLDDRRRLGKVLGRFLHGRSRLVNLKRLHELTIWLGSS
jgi:hypothetical protein